MSEIIRGISRGSTSVSLSLFGGVPGGAIDNTAAITRWLAASTGGVGFVPDGDFLWISPISVTLDGPLNIEFAAGARFVFDNGTSINSSTAFHIEANGHSVEFINANFDGSERCNVLVDITQATEPADARPNFTSTNGRYYSTRLRAGAGQPSGENAALSVRGAFACILSDADKISQCYRDATAGTPGATGTAGFYAGKYADPGGPDPNVIEVRVPEIQDISTDATGMSANNVDCDGLKVFQSTDGQLVPGGMRLDVLGGTFKNCRGRGIKGQLSDASVDEAKFIQSCEPILGDATGSGGSVFVDLQTNGGTVSNCTGEYNTWSGNSPFVVQGATAYSGCSGFLVRNTVNTARGRNGVDNCTIYNNVSPLLGALSSPFSTSADGDTQNAYARMDNNSVVGGAVVCLVSSGEMGSFGNVDQIGVSGNFATLVLQSLFQSTSVSNTNNLIARYIGNASGAPAVTATVASIDTTTNIITATAHGFYTGQVVWMVLGAGASAPGGLTEADAGSNGFQPYWIIRLSADTFKLASSPANVVAGTAVDIITAGSGTIQFVASPMFHMRSDGVILNGTSFGFRSAYQNEGFWRPDDPSNFEANIQRATGFGGVSAGQANGRGLAALSIQDISLANNASWQFKPTGLQTGFFALIADGSLNDSVIFFNDGTTFAALASTGANVTFGTDTDPAAAGDTSVWKSDIRGAAAVCVSITNRTGGTLIYHLIAMASC